MQAFGYHDPTSTARATGTAKEKPDGKYLAGGQSLIATMKLGLATPSDLIDLAKVPDLRGIKVEGNAVTIGAPAAVINAICDAVGAKDVEMPATPERVWRALNANART